MAAWLAHWLGLLNVSGMVYAFYSGSGSVIIPPILSGLVVGALFWWHHQCHVSGCFWYARRTTAAGERACWRHHPHKKRTAEQIHEAHHAALDAAPAVPATPLEDPVLKHLDALHDDLSGLAAAIRASLSGEAAEKVAPVTRTRRGKATS